MVYIRWLFRRSKSKEDVLLYCSTELLRKVDSEHLRLKNFAEFFSDDQFFFRTKNNEEVDEAILESPEPLLIQNTTVSEDECQYLNSGLNQICESSRVNESNDVDNSLLPEKNHFSPADNNLVDHLPIDYSINVDDNNLVDDHIDEVFNFLCLL